MRKPGMLPLRFRDVEPTPGQEPQPGVAFRRDALDEAKDRYPMRGEEFIDDAAPPASTSGGDREDPDST